MAAGKLFGLKLKEPAFTVEEGQPIVASPTNKRHKALNASGYILVTVDLKGTKTKEAVKAELLGTKTLEIEVEGTYRLHTELPAPVDSDEKNGYLCHFDKRNGSLAVKLPHLSSPAGGGEMGGGPPPGFDPEEAMMMGMDPAEVEMMMAGESAGAEEKRVKLVVDDIPIVRTPTEIVAYFLMRREAAKKERCPHMEKNLVMPAGWLDIKLKKMFRECRCKSRSHMWTCLNCYQVHCASCGETRTDHFKKTKHGLSMNMKCETWCWECAGDPLDERIAVPFVRIWELKYGKKPADVLEALEQCQGIDLKSGVAELLNTSGDLGEKFQDYNERMNGMMKSFDALVSDLSANWGAIDDWECQD